MSITFGGLGNESRRSKTVEAAAFSKEKLALEERRTMLAKELLNEIQRPLYEAHRAQVEKARLVDEGASGDMIHYPALAALYDDFIDLYYGKVGFREPVQGFFEAKLDPETIEYYQHYYSPYTHALEIDEEKRTLFDTIDESTTPEQLAQAKKELDKIEQEVIALKARLQVEIGLH